jgi:hypothetical protein
VFNVGYEVKQMQVFLSIKHLGFCICDRTLRRGKNEGGVKPASQRDTERAILEKILAIKMLFL